MLEDANEVLALVNKVFRKGTKGKELDPRQFDAEEKKAFDVADQDQWLTHIRTGAVRIIPPEEAAKIDRTRILR